MAAPTVAQGAPFLWAILCDTNFGPLSILTAATSAYNSDNNNATDGGIVVNARQFAVNQAGGWDRLRANQDNITLINASGVTTTQTSADQTNYNSRGGHFWLNITAITAGSVGMVLRGRDLVSGVYLTILTQAVQAATGFTAIEVGPGITATVNVSAATQLPRTWDIQAAVVTGPATFTVAASLNV